jgi:2-phosphosulfolactate phosphatase
MIVDVALLPGDIREAERKVAIVVDALRASATILAMFESGASSIIVAADPDQALTIAGSKRERYLICGEADGLPPAGFDHGNSPQQLSQIDLAGREIVLSTSNGTRALLAVAETRLSIVGAGRNAKAAASHALLEAERTASDLAIVCAGDDLGTAVSLEDAFFAGYFVELIARQRSFDWPVDESDPGGGDPSRLVLDESAILARRLYRSYASNQTEADSDPTTEIVQGMFRETRNGRTLPRLGYASDLEYCAQVNCSTVVPILRHRDRRLVLVVGR